MVDLGCLGTALVEVLGGEVDVEVAGFEVTGARVHLGVRKSKGPRGSKSAERADGFKQLFPSDIDA